MSKDRTLTQEQTDAQLSISKERFLKNAHRHNDIKWTDVEAKLKNNTSKLWSLSEMERTGGEPDVTEYDTTAENYIFCDCSKESPSGRRSLCYDREALYARKEFKPENSAIDLANEIGIEILNEKQYKKLQENESFDLKTSSWILTPNDIRKSGGAVFAEFRYGHVFVFHNGASSYYAARGFRGLLKV